MPHIKSKQVLSEYLIVIKKDANSDRLYIDKFELDKVLDSYLNKIREKAKLEQNSIIDLEDSILNTENPLKKLYECYHSSYSPHPNRAYSQESYLRRINKKKYLESIKSFDDDKKKRDYETSVKNAQIEKLALFTKVFYLGEAYKKADNEPFVMFYSHGTPG